MGKSNGGFSEGAFSNNRFVLKPVVAIASEVSILSKNSLAITDFHAKKTQRVQLFENPLPGTPPFAIPVSLANGNARLRCTQLGNVRSEAEGAHCRPTPRPSLPYSALTVVISLVIDSQTESPFHQGGVSEGGVGVKRSGSEKGSFQKGPFSREFREF